MEGGTEPSAVQNFQQGNYGTAALQGLGAMGDLMYAVPVLGATVGSAMKGPRAAQKMLRELSPAEQAIPSADVILEKAKEVEGLCDFMNCKLFSQMVSGIPEITNLPKVDKAQVGDIYAWPNGTHYAVDIGDGKVIEVEEWGEAPRVISMSDVIKELDPPESILRPPPGTYTPKKVESSALPSKAKKELNELIEQAPRATDQGSLPTETKEFKSWFGDSKAVNSEGEPIVLYHGTNQDINEFTTQPGAMRDRFYAGELGSWFGDDPKIANQFAKGVRAPREGGAVYPVFLSIKNPKVFDSYEDFMSATKGRRSAPAVRKDLIKEGYDGIQIKDSTTDLGGRRDDWVAFYPEQVKSPFNVGTYDPEDPRILYGAGAAGAGTAGILSLTPEEAEAGE
jgi:hypothetical protein